MAGDERLDMVGLIRRERAAQLLARQDVKRSLLTLIFDMDMSTVVLHVLLGLHPDENALEHGKCCHYSNLLSEPRNAMRGARCLVFWNESFMLSSFIFLTSGHVDIWATSGQL